MNTLENPTKNQPDARLDASAALIFQALDPAQNVVVEACAGSGKTWLLASRIVRLLLAGVAPGEILAITFTRKAAREIEERVLGWLHFLATSDSAQLTHFLAERGVLADEKTRLVARQLYETVLLSPGGLAVNTFHGWFLQLVAAAPWSADLAGTTLTDADSRFFDEIWQSFAADLQKMPEAQALRAAFLRQLGVIGADALRRLLRRAFDRRSEWLAFGDIAAASPEIAEKVIEQLGEQLGAGEVGQALGDFFTANWALDFHAYLGFLEQSELKTDQAAAQTLRNALAQLSASEATEKSEQAAHFSTLAAVFLTQENTLRIKKLTTALVNRYTAAGAERFLAWHAELGARLLQTRERQTAEQILFFNQDIARLFAAFLAHAEAFKKARRQIDFVDAEWNVLQLLRDEASAAFLQAKLDARYRHVLLDEFQDTNPLQWQILLAWLSAYSDAGRPGLFLVGDPKQSIYRFRRAEPRLFGQAADFLVREFNAVRCEQDVTRRNAAPIIDVINALFLDAPEFSPFRKQSSLADKLPGRVELLPLFGQEAERTEEASDAPELNALRNPLLEAAPQFEDARLRLEALAIADKIGQIVGHWAIEASGANGERTARPARYDDILLLVRTRTHLAIYERALSEACIPFDAGSRGGLLAALEVRDLVALLEFLVTPMADLALAQTLRSPIFACSDEELLILAARAEATWWQRIKALVVAGEASPRLQRAERLLRQWQQAASRLPAHDLLDRIFHEGEIIARYRRAAPELAIPRVEANLRALLLLALELDGARYPSLPRFIDELRALHQLDNNAPNEAPDEGAIETQNTYAGRVRILTIHGAKGLEAPIVCLLGANSSARAKDAWDMLVDWPPDAAAPTHLSFFGRKDERGAARQALFDVELAAEKREELNLLYVAITRACQVFIASGSEARSAPNTPYRLLEAALTKLDAQLIYGDDFASGADDVVAERLPNDSLAVLEADPPWPSIGERRSPPDAAARFGILLHALLERRTGDSVSGESDHWWASLGFSESEYRRALPLAERLLHAPNLQRFFDATQYLRAWNEVELVDRKAQRLRIDRLVETESEVWVLDYKSSGQRTERLDEYRAQLAQYGEAVSEIFSAKTVRGALIFSDASTLE